MPGGRSRGRASWEFIKAFILPLPRPADKGTLLVNFPDQMDDPSEELPRRRSLIDETARALRLAIARGTWVEFLPVNGSSPSDSR